MAAGGLSSCGASSGHDRTTTSAAPGAAPARPATQVVIPQLVGVEQGRAHRVAARAGVKIRVMGYVGKYGNGRYNVGCVKVISQSPVGGERRPRGSFVSVIEKECRTPQTGPVPPAGSEPAPHPRAASPSA